MPVSMVQVHICDAYSLLSPYWRPQHRGAAVVAVDKATKSAIAGRQSVSFGQTTATGGLLQSSPCAQPSKPMRLQEKKKNKRHTERAHTGSLVSLQHDVCHCGPALMDQSPLPQQCLILQYSHDVPFSSVGLWCHNSLHTRLRQSKERG